MPEVEVKPTDPVTPKEEQNKEEKKVTDVLYDKTEKEDEKPTEEEKRKNRLRKKFRRNPKKLSMNLNFPRAHR